MITIEKVHNWDVLANDLVAAFPGIEATSIGGEFVAFDEAPYDAGQITSITALINAHNPNDLSSEQIAEQVAANAESQAANIPGWATWDETTALAWFDSNIGDNLPVANLAAANAVLEDMATMQRAMVRMIIALRNKNFPNLQE